MENADMVNPICGVLEKCDSFYHCAQVLMQAAITMGFTDWESLKEAHDEALAQTAPTRQAATQANVDRGILHPEALDQYKK